MTNKKERKKVVLRDTGNPALILEWFKEKVPPEILVKCNPKFLVHAHSYGGLSKFFKGLTHGALYGTKCWDCGGVNGNIWLPPRVHCPDCWKETVWMTVDTTGAKVYTHSTTNLPGAGFKGSVPCTLISVDIPGTCTKFMSYMSECGEGEPYIGMPVRPAFNTKDPTYTILDVSWVPAD